MDSIKVNNLSKSYGDYLAIDNINFSVEKGTIHGLLGENGAGKTTTMRILTGFLKPSSGSIKINGLDLFKNLKKAREKSLNYIGKIKWKDGFFRKDIGWKAIDKNEDN